MHPMQELDYGLFISEESCDLALVAVFHVDLVPHEAVGQAVLGILFDESYCIVN